MVLEQFWSWLEGTELAIRIAESWWFPLLESLHVVAVALVVGAILMIDLRLLGVAARSYAVSALSRDLLRWSWLGFAMATVTGIGLFITRAYYYVGNPAFQAKLVLLLLAGVNIAVFHFVVARDQTTWDQAQSNAAATPLKAKLAGLASLLLWSGVVLAGRWTGHISG
jgi:hypothetical protein